MRYRFLLVLLWLNLIGDEVGMIFLNLLENIGAEFEGVEEPWVDFLSIEAGVFGIGGHDLAVPAG